MFSKKFSILFRLGSDAAILFFEATVIFGNHGVRLGLDTKLLFGDLVARVGHGPMHNT